jgi:deoxycytidylate deaminase
MIKIAMEEAEKSNYRYKVGAIIFKANRIYSKGHNYQSRTVKHLHPKLRNPYYSLHAEIDAISNLNRDSSNLDLLIIRVAGKKNKRLAMAKPCIHCQSSLLHIPFRRIYFSNELGQIEVFSSV